MDNDFLTIGVDEGVQSIESSQPNGRKQDPNLWKPGISDSRPKYEAMVRLLPQGINGIKNKLPASVQYQMHYLKHRGFKIFKNIPCRKTIGEECPICDRAWAMFNQGKDNNDEKLKNIAKDRLPVTRHVINVFVRDDLTVPDNNGKVLKWDHTDNINSQLMAPLVNKKDEGGEQTSGFKKKSEKEEKFNPYSPKNSRDRVVIVEPNPRNPTMPTYDGSFWDDETNGNGYSDLAATDEEMMAILDQCHDLSGYRDVPTAEEAIQQYQEFENMIASKQAAIDGGQVQESRSSFGGNTAAPAKNVTTANAGEYFEAGNNAGGSNDILDMNDGAPMGSPVDEPITETTSAPISDADDDDLPF